MESDVYDARLALHDVEVVRPTPAEMECLNVVIFDELCRGVVSANGHDLLRRIC
jgi:aspartate/glutamate racemase